MYNCMYSRTDGSKVLHRKFLILFVTVTNSFFFYRQLMSNKRCVRVLKDLSSSYDSTDKYWRTDVLKIYNDWITTKMQTDLYTRGFTPKVLYEIRRKDIVCCLLLIFFFKSLLMNLSWGHNDVVNLVVPLPDYFFVIVLSWILRVVGKNKKGNCPVSLSPFWSFFLWFIFT
jgi:hypothetical protein